MTAVITLAAANPTFVRGQAAAAPPTPLAMLTESSSLARTLYLTAMFYILSCVTPFDACAADGYFDAGFAGNGRLLVDVSIGPKDTGQVLRLRSDGRMFLAGTCDHVESIGGGATIPFPAFCAAQLKIDGSYDTLFGPGGVGYLRFDRFAGWPNNASLADAIILKDGRALLAGRPTENGTIIAVLSATGATLDTSIAGGKGFVLLSSHDPTAPDAAFNADNGPSKLIQQPDGKILISGSDDGPNGNVDFSVIRLMADLSGPDPDFATNGRQTVTFDLGGPSGLNADQGRAMVRQADGKILLAGFAALTETSYVLAVARLLENGTLDSTFGANHDGRAHFAPSLQSAVSAMVVDAQGRIVLGGVGLDPSGTYGEFLVDRLLPDGTQDPTFHGGVPYLFLVQPNVASGLQGIYDIALQSDGKILAFGELPRAAGSDNKYWGVARLLADGTLDSTFGAGGRSFGLVQWELRYRQRRHNRDRERRIAGGRRRRCRL